MCNKDALTYGEEHKKTVLHLKKRSGVRKTGRRYDNSTVAN